VSVSQWPACRVTSAPEASTRPARAGDLVRIPDYVPPMSRDPQADAREYDPMLYWRDPGSSAAKGLTSAYWNDPFPDLQGVLTSEHIRLYHERVGRMIRPFDSGLLKTASYELTLGTFHLVEGEDRQLTISEPHLRLPPNSLSFVSMQQVLLMPHYLVGRFDLAIHFIYQGLLLGTGPQVDPGFQGALGCPLHNISNREIVIDLGESFAKIDFAKTVPRPIEVREEWAKLGTERELARWFEDEPTGSYSRIFKAGRPPWRRPVYDYISGRPTSSVRKIQTRVDRYRNFGVGAIVVAALTVLVGLPGLVFLATEFFAGGKADQSNLTVLEHRSATRMRRLQEEVKGLERELEQPRPNLGHPSHEATR
jgi:deoxycytidine triphosphate deaminase